jgi:hypothetical protein
MAHKYSDNCVCDKCERVFLDRLLAVIDKGIALRKAVAAGKKAKDKK